MRHEKGLLAADLERAAARAPRPPPTSAAPLRPVLALLLRRGFHPRPSKLDLPFAPDLEEPAAQALCARLSHYAFRLFLRGAIQRRGPFTPEQATRYLDAPRAREEAEALVEMGLAERLARGRYRLRRTARTFGATLEWYVARELHRRLGFDTAVGLRFGAKGVGGDLDVVAAADGRLIYLELKSGPPKHLSRAEVAAFFARLRALRPDVALFVVDTALRLSDKVIPMLAEELRHGTPRCVRRDLWVLTPHVFVVNAKYDLMANIAEAIALGLQAHTPEPP